MASIINTNMASIMAQRNLNKSQGAQADAMQRLSSGLRINSAKDDAAGLAISTRFSSQTQGLAVAIRNAGDGISLAQTAEGALGTMTDSLQRIRELALQAANGTNSATDREALNAEAQQMIEEINRTATETNFNGQKLLDGSFTTQFQVGANAGETIGVTVADLGVDNLGVSDQAGVSAVGTDAALGNGDLVINGVNIESSSAADDDASTNNAAASAIAKAAAINRHSDESGVTAIVDSNTVSGSVQDDPPTAVTGGKVTINDVEIDVDTTGDAATTRAAVAAAINAVSDQTGVKAVDSGDSATGVTLEAADGRNIELTLASGLTSGNTGLASGADEDGAGSGTGTTYEGGYTLIAQGDTKTLDIQGGNGTGNGNLANAGLSKGDYTPGVSAVSGSAVTGEATVAATGGSGSLDLNALKGTDFDAANATLTINGQSVTVNGNLSQTENPSTATIDFSSIYTGAGKDFSGTGTTNLTITVEGTATDIDLTGDYRQNVQNTVIQGLDETQVNALTGPQTLQVDGEDISFDSTGFAGLTGATLATALETAINSGVAEYNAVPGNTALDGVSVSVAGDGTLVVASDKAEGGSVADGGGIIASATSVVRNSKADNAGLVLDGTATFANGNTLDLVVNGSAVTYTGAGGGTTLADFAADITTNVAGASAAVVDGNLVISTDTVGSGGSLTNAGTGTLSGAADLYSVEARLNDDDLETELGTIANINISQSTPAGTDGVFNIVGTTPGSAGTLSVVDGAGTDASGLSVTSLVEGTTSPITDQQLKDAIDLTSLSAAGLELSLDGTADDGIITVTTIATGVGNSVTLDSDGGTGASFSVIAAGADELTAAEHNLDAGDLVINNVAIKAAQAADDVASYADAVSSSKTASGISIASAVNKSTGETGVSAVVNASEYVGGDTSTDGTSGNTGSVWINGVEVNLTVQTGASANRAHAVDQINAVSGQTGVVASDNGKSLSLTGADGRNIVLAFDTNAADNGGTTARDFGLGLATGVGSTAISESDLTTAGAVPGTSAKAQADLAAKTTYSTVTLSGAGDINVAAGINGSDDLSNLGFTAGTFGGGKDGTFLKDVDLSSVDGANAALTAIDNALDAVNAQRADLGAIQNRFETTVENLQVTSENLTSSNSRIRDADFAAETAELSRTRVLQQAGTSILAQANALPQQVLSLLQ